MEIFLGTLIIIIACCIAMGLGLILSGKPLKGGCGSQLSKSTGCVACPNRGKKKTCKRSSEITEEVGRQQC
jgi:hypothetical protein